MLCARESCCADAKHTYINTLSLMQGNGSKTGVGESPPLAVSAATAAAMRRTTIDLGALSGSV
jgi:hypothetical protein